MPLSTRAQSTFTLFAVTLSIGTSLLAGEWFLRSFYHFPDSLAPFTPFRNNLPGSHFQLVQKEFDITLEYNRQGFRDSDFEKKLDAPKKLIFLGDSFIQGFGVEEENRASNLVETELNKNSTGRTVSVFNAGQIMSGPFHYFLNLIRFGIALKPDVVVVGLFMGNDFIEAHHRLIPNGYRVREQYPIYSRELDDKPFWRISYLLTLVQSFLDKKNLIQRRINSNQYWKFFYGKEINRDFFFEMSGMDHKEFENHISTIPESTLDDFFSGRINPSYLTSSFLSTKEAAGPSYTGDDIRNVFNAIYEMYFICSQRKIPFLLVIFPSPYQVFPQEYSTHLKQNFGYKKVPESLKELDNIHQALIEWLRIEAIDSIDLKQILNIEDYYLFDGHLNSKGQFKVADQILNRIRPWVEVN
ncbi:MAG: hypothetical protein G3M70_11990 [Candidatus Nitronauta litoralis]|uniref:SGNH hydrolase-type esterase domain-containing protein n=1 Tax=Candidatus Nitronauta litoralis TaxID=2705533 RepID=A0A7T0BWZ9_9BACT|nr:MAG: hypothetical protein G3M70_11990 [Candidatus Nitronauta litoralis]